MRKSLNSHGSVILALIVANIIWGAASPIFKWSLDNVPLFTLAFLRFFFASLILAPYAFAYDFFIKKRDLPLILSIGFVMFLNITFYFLGLKSAPSINAPIIASSGPILIILLSVRILHEHPKHKVILGTVLSLMGVLIIVLKGFIESTNGEPEVLGNLFYLLSTIFAVFHALLSKKALYKYKSLVITWWYFLLTSIFFTPFFIYEIKTVGFLPDLDIRGIIGIVFGILFVSALAHSLYIWGISKIKANEIGIFTYIDPVAALLIAIPLLGEKITLSYLLGSFFVFLGIFIAEGRIHWHPVHRLRKSKN